jgi:hypothetical protein
MSSALKSIDIVITLFKVLKKSINPIEGSVNPSARQAKRPTLLRVDPERHFLTQASKAGLAAAEWVNLRNSFLEGGML